MSTLFSGPRFGLARAGAAVAVAAAAIVATAGTSFAAGVTGTLSSASGPSGGGNTITIVTSTAKFFTGAVVEFQYSTSTTAPTATTCSAAYSTPAALSGTTNANTTGIVAVSNPKVLSTTKLVVTVPATLAIPGGSSATSAAFAVCVYPGTNTTTSLLTVYGSVKYQIAAAPTVTAVSPAGGPALGGGTVTITGTNFITGMTATLGGLPITSGTVVSATTFTGIAPAHAAGAVTVAVNTTGGGANLPSAYTYSDGLIVSPNTTPTGTVTTDLDISGVGFTSKTFTTTAAGVPDDANAHVYLVSGGYDNTSNVGAKTNGQKKECTDVLVISDTELICSLDTSNTDLGGVPAAATTTTVSTTSGSATLTKTGGTAFSSADIGKVVTGAGIPADTYITDYTSATVVTMSANATATAAGVTATLGEAPNVEVSTGTTASNTALTAWGGTAFTSASVGAHVYGAGIPVGTTIVAVGSGTAATLSQAATATGAGVNIAVGVAIPNGTYTVTIVGDGSVGGAGSPSIISSGSTFTVAPF